MDINTELTGGLVLVHPALEHDPAGKQNTIGVIRFADMADDGFYVAFSDHTTALYASDALFVLKSVDEIHHLLVDHGDRLAFPELKALTQLDLTIRYGDGDKLRNALQLAVNNPDIQPLCLDLLKDVIQLQQTNARKR
ncbi:hypothetical protein PQ469_12155 [Mucilaginibacter sp. KACC 22773]|uniref:hypothetical protein n=1 Tax=Mucilaginibacter sp. KACC 22773 TaxID=3025671 RepID=UPI002365A85E|nr:hypothetical protein [Mucilaginibacter sp. KACC 22773]WDF80760.1 hypothetical protein PQ469_12155 [Mucilaginibacter sp. KACC 22773]